MLVQTNSSNQLDDIYPNNLVEYPDVSPSHSNISPFLNSVSEHEFFKSHSIPSDESDLVTPEPEGLRPLPEIDASKSDSPTDINYTESSLTNMDFSDTEEFEEEYPPILPHLPDQPFAFSLKSSEQFKLARKKGRNSKGVSERASHSKNKEVSHDSNSESEPQSYPETSSTTDNKDSRVTGNDAFYIPWGSERDRLGCAPLYPQPLKAKTPLPSGFSLLSKNLRESLSSLTNAVVFPKPANPEENNVEGSSSEDQPPGDELYGCSFPNCNKTFNCIYNLRSHYKIHTSDRPFKCDVCHQSFSRNHDLKRHQKIHLGYKPYRCSICDRTFGRLDALKRHNSVRRCAERKAKSLVRK